jgi:hypothetical protein
MSGENEQVDDIGGQDSVTKLAVQVIFLLWPQFPQL